MKKQLVLLFLFNFIACFFFTACTTKNDDPKPDKNAGANTVSGTVLDTHGQPMAGVKVRAENPTGANIYVDGTTGADGKYALPLSTVGGWKIYAWKEVAYKGKTYLLRMGMPDDRDYDAFTAGDKGVTKNFVWKLSGRIADRGADVRSGAGYFGGSLRFVNDNAVVPAMVAGTQVTITLAPTVGATYLDGTPAGAAGTIVKSFTITNDADQNYYLSDIPVTEYHISVTSARNNIQKQVYVGEKYSNLYEWLEFDFNPVGGSSGTYESGILTPTNTPFYLGQKN
ncbi:carboxypeptidase-like regulatory domain-containing protein [Adhaeribacter pallidiroseus]|uniref:Carboxypeptidase regulatory-like domain-containing protein n=1 Tax=Adhaeribacter pallidiroseus TaxID=2072847 RepID=A0A369QW03_9BACT|nr:carboxypeptidase-like regulatory domain-containing protein [Adhaeribacter pallidiroseus]RDC66348.1 hypothetical protein AHMF7616_04979 [Adhaeribacter pallidiroseus]